MLLYEVPHFDVDSSEHNRTIIEWNSPEARQAMQSYKPQALSIELMVLFSLPLMGYDGNLSLRYSSEVDTERAFHREMNKRILYAFDQQKAVNNLTHIEDAMAVALDSPHFDMD